MAVLQQVANFKKLTKVAWMASSWTRLEPTKKNQGSWKLEKHWRREQQIVVILLTRKVQC